jgi:Spy/CpxP family protein refolding chaperone
MKKTIVLIAALALAFTLALAAHTAGTKVAGWHWGGGKHSPTLLAGWAWGGDGAAEQADPES